MHSIANWALEHQPIDHHNGVSAYEKFIVSYFIVKIPSFNLNHFNAIKQAINVVTVYCHNRNTYILPEMPYQHCPVPKFNNISAEFSSI